jgi:hypothetical protein
MFARVDCARVYEWHALVFNVQNLNYTFQFSKKYNVSYRPCMVSLQTSAAGISHSSSAAGKAFEAVKQIAIKLLLHDWHALVFNVKI